METIYQGRRRAVAALGAGMGGLLLGAATRPAWAAWRPDQTVEFVVPAGPGGALDQTGRAMKQFYDESHVPGGKTFLVTNKPGANGKIAFEVLLQKRADPHYLSINSHGYISSYLTGNLDILPHRDLTPIAVIQDEFVVAAVRTESPVQSAADLAERLRKDPTSQRIGVATSIGNHIHISTAKALGAAGVDVRKLVVAPFKSSAESMVALVGGHLDVVAATTPNVIALKKAGKIRVLAVSAGQRLGGQFADVPTWKEQGIDSTFSSAMGIVAAKGISEDQIQFWEDMCRRMSQSPMWEQLAETNQSRPNFMGHRDAARFYEEEYQGMREIVAKLGLLGAGK